MMIRIGIVTKIESPVFRLLSPNRSGINRLRMRPGCQAWGGEFFFRGGSSSGNRTRDLRKGLSISNRLQKQESRMFDFVYLISSNLGHSISKRCGSQRNLQQQKLELLPST